MVSLTYSEAASEVLSILQHTDEEAVKKIPKKFIRFLEENSSRTYKPEFDTSKSIKDLKLKPKTEALLGIIYLKYWANEVERKEFYMRAKENEEKYQKNLREKYSTDMLFKKRRT